MVNNMIDTSIKKQQWELLASPGHVLLAQVDCYRLKLKLPMFFAAAAAVLVYLSFVIAPLVGSGAGGVAGWITSSTKSMFTAKPLAPSPAPELAPFASVLPAGLRFDVARLPRLMEDVAPEMRAQLTAMKASQKTTNCTFDKKITEIWTDGQDFSPRCRYSADGSRLWVWAGVVNDSGNYRPWAGLIAKRGGDVQLYNIEGSGLLQLPNQASINPAQIPRAVAQDFPELVQK